VRICVEPVLQGITSLNLTWIDWSIFAVFVVALAGFAAYAKQYNKSVVDFLAANRCAGRYLLSITQGITGIGAISFISYFEMYYASGFSGLWWLLVSLPIALLISMSGYVRYRYRETRVLTMAQLFEVRYSRNFRVFAGILMWCSGVLNMGIFPAVTARIFIHLCDFPPTFSVFGIEGISTFVAIMLFELSLALIFTFMGGMIVVIVTDFFQGIFCNVAFLLILGFLLIQFDWDQIVTALSTAPENASMFNPYKTSQVKGFDLAFFIMYYIGMVYTWMAWQGSQGYNAAAKSAHEAKMSGVIGGWRIQIQNILVAVIPICVFVFFTHGDFASEAQQVQHTIEQIQMPTAQETETIRTQMTVPIALSAILPTGLIGLLVAVFFAAAISTDDTYLHSWGSIFVQDVILPFRKSGFTQKQHLWLLRFSVIFVAVIIFFFSLFYKQNDYILMFMQVTGVIYLGGAGSVIVGGLYWKRGTTAAAWASLIVGGTIAVGGMLLRSNWASVVPLLQEWFPASKFLAANVKEFPYDGMRISFFAYICAITSYVSISLFEWLILRKPAFNMNRMLHRGEYAIKGEHEGGVSLPPTGWRTLLPTKEFTGSDRILFLAMIIWSVGWSLFVVGVTLYHIFWGTSDRWWQSYWYFYLWMITILGTGTTIWFVIGGLSNLKDLFRILRTAERNLTDDGRVAGGKILADESLPKDRSDSGTGQAKIT
jgi:SSS family solute:Na+ symporter